LYVVKVLTDTDCSVCIFVWSCSPHSSSLSASVVPVWRWSDVDSYRRNRRLVWSVRPTVFF